MSLEKELEGYSPPPADLSDVVECEVRSGCQDPNEILKVLRPMVASGQVAASRGGKWEKDASRMVAETVATILAERKQLSPHENGDPSLEGGAVLRIGTEVAGTVTKVVPSKHIHVRVPSGNGRTVKVHILWEGVNGVHVKPAGEVRVRITRLPRGGDEPSFGGELVRQS